MSARKASPADALYRRMVAEATGFIRSFETDLTKHDRAFLDHPERPVRFGWVLYRQGTHTVKPGVRFSTAMLVSDPAYWGADLQTYIADGSTLERVSRHEFVSVMTAESCRVCGGAKTDHSSIHRCICRTCDESECA